MTIVAPHFLHRILTIFPRTFSSAMVYFAWQDWHEIFKRPPNGRLTEPTPRSSSERRWPTPAGPGTRWDSQSIASGKESDQVTPTIALDARTLRWISLRVGSFGVSSR